MPIILAKQQLRKMTKGQLLCVLSTDPAATSDFEAMLKHRPDELLKISVERMHDVESEPKRRIFKITIRKG